MAMTFKTNLLPDQDLVRELGSSTQKWKINGVTDPKLTDTVTTVTTSGSGNAITAISASNGAITAIKGSTFLTSHQDISGKVNKSGDTMTGSLTINKTGAMPLNIGPYGGAYGTSGTGQIWYCGTNATATNYIKDTIYIGSTGNQNLKAATMYTNIVQVNTGTNPDGNTQGHGVKIWHDAEGGNIGIYAGKSNQTDNYYYEIDAPSGLLRVSVLKNGAYLSTPCYISPTQGLFGAVWNDYAEFRKDNEKEKDAQQPGRCIKENGDGTLSLTTRRLERGCEIISDTFGFSIGQDEENGYNTPIASNGRVLAYPYESIEEFTNHIGWPVCSGPNGTVSIMTEEEEEKYPSRIIGTISEIPSYEEWGTGKVKVNGRIWIRIK